VPQGGMENQKEKVVDQCWKGLKGSKSGRVAPCHSDYKIKASIAKNCAMLHGLASSKFK
jgi:hypothetical protein